MKAAVLFSTKDIRYTDIPEPQVGDQDIKIKIAAAGICGSDIPRVLQGRVHSFPLVLGHEFSGIVVAKGEGVPANINIGDHVVGAPLLPCGKCDDCRKGNFSLCRHYSFVGSRQQGAFAEYLVLPQSNVIKISKDIPLEHAVFFETSAVALHALKHIAYRGGSAVAILGGGTIGLLAMQWAKIFGAASVAVIGRSKEHLTLASKLGADAVFSSLDENYQAQALNFTNNNGFNYIFEAAGSVHTMKMAFSLAANKAKLCFIGTPTEDLIFSPSEWELMNRKEFTLTGSWMSYSSPFPGDEWILTSHYFSKGLLKIDDSMIYKRFPLKDISEAFNLFYERNKVKGRILILP